MRETISIGHRSSRFLIAFLLALSALLSVVSAAAADDPKLWDAIKSGEAFAIMRHALAPGTGDPQKFSIAYCATQRNLSKQGREQARMIGDRFSAQGITSVEIYSSEWCRCKDTAKLLKLGPVKTLPILNSFFETYGRRDAQTREIKKWLIAQKTGKPLVLVSHQVNIFALTGKPTSSGETVVARISETGDVTVLGTLE